jgi:hypothetical protein
LKIVNQGSGPYPRGYRKRLARNGHEAAIEGVEAADDGKHKAAQQHLLGVEAQYVDIETAEFDSGS